ncbi:MAG: AI-2E family transporter [Acidobacteriota bacterium]
MIELDSRQRKTIATAATILAVLVILGAIASVFWTIARFVGAFAHVLLPVAVAGIAALVFQPYYDWLRDRLRMPAPVALSALLLSILVPVGAFLWFFGALLVEQIADLVSNVPAYWQSLRDNLQSRWPLVQRFLEQDPTGQRISEVLNENGGVAVVWMRQFGQSLVETGLGAVRAVGALLSWIVLPIYFAFFLMVDKKSWREDLDGLLPFFKPSTRGDVIYLAREFVGIVVAFFRGQLVIAFLQGLLFAIGFSVVGLRYGFVLGLTLGLLNIVPYLGNIVGLGVALPLAYFQSGGGWGLVLGVMVVFVIVQSIEGYLLTPKIMGDQTGLHPVAIIFAIFFWGSALQGIAGMILAIPLTAFLVVFWKLLKEKYVREWV